MRGLVSMVSLGILLAGGWALGANWPQFEGPNRDGISPETGLAHSWPAGGPKVLWRIDLGIGFGGAAIRDGKVYVLDRIKGKRDILKVLDLNTGKLLWSYGYDAPGIVQQDYPGSRSTPTVDDKNVYIMGPLGSFHCVSQETHQPIWQTDIVTDWGAKRANWGVAQAPLLYKDMLILAPQSNRAGLVAFNKDTGKVIWTSASIGSMQYLSPQVAKVDGMDQIVMGAMVRRNMNFVGVDPSDGKILWKYDGWRCSIPVPSPTQIGDGRFFITGDYNAGCAMWKVTHADGQWQTTELFKNHNCDSHVHNALLAGGYLYANSSKTNRGLVCLDLSGNIMWQTGRNPSFDLGGDLIIADGLIYIMDGANGTLYMVKLDPHKYVQLGKFKCLSGPMVWSPMALSQGKLVVRDQHQMKCLDVKSQ